MNSTPIVLVPGFWLGAWAWDEVATALRGDEHDVTAMTLPGLESADADRSSITLADHVEAICEAVTAAGARRARRAQRHRVLRVRRERPHPGADRGHGLRRLRPGQGRDGSRLRGCRQAAWSWEEIAAEENLDGLSEEHLETFRQRAVPSRAASCARVPS